MSARLHRDERLSQALETLTGVLDRVDQRLARMERETASQTRSVEREAEHPALHDLGAGLGGMPALAIPGFAAQWTTVVPSEYVEVTPEGWRRVRCPCGSSPVVERGQPTECAGSCDRWFLWDGNVVRVATWREDAA